MVSVTLLNMGNLVLVMLLSGSEMSPKIHELKAHSAVRAPQQGGRDCRRCRLVGGGGSWVTGIVPLKEIT